MSKILDKIVLRDTKTGISTEYTIQDTQLKERVENLIANKNDTNGNSELIDIRTGFDGSKYDTAGDAVRSQVSNLQEQVNDINNNGLIFNDDYISLKIDTWLKDHPEATTTVLDNSITKEKIEEDFLYDLRKARFYNSVADMKSDSELKAGQVCKTLGYYSTNDGGGAYYVIRAKQDNDVDDGGSIHELANGLIAELIVENGTVNVKQFGAKGDGVTDDTQAIQKASIFRNLIFDTGVYILTSDISLNCITMLDGVIKIENNVVLTVGSLNCDESTVCFSGIGTVKIKNNQFSLGWFDGDSANEKWDFIRRAIVEDEWYKLIIPRPKNDDIASIAGRWKLTAPLIFDGKENCGVIEAKAGLRAYNDMDSMMLFSPTNKVEELTFINGIELAGGNYNINYGIKIMASARLKFCGRSVIERVETCVYASDENSGCDELQFDFLNCTAYYNKGVHISGGHNSHAIFATKINFLMTNGAKSQRAKNLLHIEGNVRNLTFNKIFEYAYEAENNKHYDVTESLIKINNNDNGSPNYIIFDDVYATVTRQKVFDILNSNYIDIKSLVAFNVTDKLALLANNSEEIKIGRICPSAITYSFVNCNNCLSPNKISELYSGSVTYDCRVGSIVFIGRKTSNVYGLYIIDLLNQLVPLIGNNIDVPNITYSISNGKLTIQNPSETHITVRVIY